LSELPAPRAQGKTGSRWTALALLALFALPIAALTVKLFREPDVHLRSPWALWLLVTVPWLAWRKLERPRDAALAFSRVSELRAAEAGWVARLRALPDVLRIVAVGLLALALVRPQRLSTDASEVEGIDIVLALDVSNSMQEKDLLPDRLTAAKRVLDRFISKRQSDRIGLVIFGSEAYTQCPLTLDTTAVRFLLQDVRIGLVDGRKTAIGNAIGTSLNRIRNSTARSKVIVLVTDGDDNASSLDPLQAARYAQTFGVRIFTILIGRDSEEGPPATDAFGNPVRRQAAAPVNPKLLEEIAGMTGGMPYLATDTDALDKRFNAILEDLERSRLRSHTPRYVDLYPLFVGPVLALLLLEVALLLTRFRRFP
jgi:Ca-activated chloride channel family protein